MNEHVDPLSLLPAGASTFLEAKHRLFIDGSFVDAASGETFTSFDPATARPIADIALANEIDVDRAVTAAKRALEGDWAKVGPGQRAALLHRLADLIEQNEDVIAAIESIDSGKPAAHIKFVDVALAKGALRYNAGWCTKIAGETLPVEAPNMHAFTRREPVGVVAAIVPWNFPLCQACFKIAPALAAGCTVVLKPAENTPLSAIFLAQLAAEAGFPAGVLNVVQGYGKSTGEALVTHPGVAKIAFTGSEAVGKHIARSASADLKHVSLELGGKNPNIIFADADIEKAAAAAAMAIFFYSGQVCSAGSRLMVERSVLDRVVAQVEAEARKIQIGHGLLPGTTMGPLISAAQRQRVDGYVHAASNGGARVVTGGRAPADAGTGFFFEPTVLLDLDDKHPTVCEEIFGPVLVVQPFDTLDEVARRANATTFGLAAGVWTRDIAKAHALAARIRSGTVWVNTYNQFDAAAPWGGYKQSGLGRDNGREGIEKFLQTKTVWVDYGAAV